MLRRLAQLFGRVKHILRTEGLLSLLRQGFAFLAGCIFRYETYYLHEIRLEGGSEADFMPRIQDFTLKVVSTNQQADELVTDGFKFRYSDGIRRERLDKGTIAFCIFIGEELAHIGWLAMNEEAQKSIVSFPFQVDFPNKEVFIGGVWTNPKYRGKGLHTYGLFKRLQFLKERGTTVSRGAVDTRNVASQRVNAKFGCNYYAEARYLKLLWWESWEEKALTQRNP